MTEVVSEFELEGVHFLLLWKPGFCLLRTVESYGTPDECQYTVADLFRQLYDGSPDYGLSQETALTEAPRIARQLIAEQRQQETQRLEELYASPEMQKEYPVCQIWTQTEGGASCPVIWASHNCGLYVRRDGHWQVAGFANSRAEAEAKIAATNSALPDDPAEELIPRGLAFLGRSLLLGLVLAVVVGMLLVLSKALDSGQVTLSLRDFRRTFLWATDPGAYAGVVGFYLAFLGAALWALQIVHVRTHRWVGTPLSLLPWQQTVAVLMLAPLAFLFEADATIRWTPESVAILAYNGPLTSGFCFWALLTVTRALPAVTTSIGSLATPLVGMLAGAWWLGEPLSATNTGGLALIAGAVAMLVLSEAWARRPGPGAMPAGS